MLWELCPEPLFNLIKPNGSYVYQLLRHSITLHVVFIGFV
jgi:hypothetical protein